MPATAVFLSSVISIALAVGGVIWLIYRVTSMAGRLRKPWVEPLIMRSAGVIVVIFSLYGLYLGISA